MPEKHQEYQAIVAYRNVINHLIVGDYTRTEIDIIHAIISKIRNKGTETVYMSAEELIKLSGYKHDKTNIDKFAKYVMETFENIKFVGVEMYDKELNQWKFHPLFQEVSYADHEIKMIINPSLERLVNDFTGEFTSFELKEFTSLKSKYTKVIYKLLKQYKYVGKTTVQIKDLKKIITIPFSYTHSHISDKIVKPSVEELQDVFEGLRVENIYSKRRLVAFEFTFKPETRGGKVINAEVTNEKELENRDYRNYLGQF